MIGQTDEKTKTTGRLRLHTAAGSMAAAPVIQVVLDCYAALDHHKLSGESMPLLAQKRASR